MLAFLRTFAPANNHSAPKMEIQQLQNIYAKHPGVKALAAALKSPSNVIQISGLQGSSAPMVFASMPQGNSPFLFILDDEEEAGYFYHDLTQMMGQERVLFFPCSYKRAIKYGQRDAANEILRTEVLTKISSQFIIHNSQFIIDNGDPLGVHNSQSDKNSQVNLSVSELNGNVNGNGNSDSKLYTLYSYLPSGPCRAGGDAGEAERADADAADGREGGHYVCAGDADGVRLQAGGLCVRAWAVCRSWQHHRRVFLFVRTAIPYRLLWRRGGQHTHLRGTESAEPHETSVSFFNS